METDYLHHDAEYLESHAHDMITASSDGSSDGSSDDDYDFCSASNSDNSSDDSGIYNYSKVQM